MLKSTQEGLEVKNSNNQTGTVHQTDYRTNSERLKEVLRKAVELQCKLNELAEYLSMDGEFDREFAEAEDRLQMLIHNDLSPMLGYLFINEEFQKMEEAV